MDRRIANRLLAPLAGVSAVLLVTAGLAAWYLRDIQGRLARSLTENVASVLAAQELETHVREVDAAIDHFLLTGDRAHLDSIPRLRRSSAAALEAAEAWALTGREKALTARAREGHDRLYDEAAAAVRDSSGRDLRDRFTALAAVPEQDVLGPVREYRRLNEDALTGTSRKTAQLADRLTIGLLALGLCGAGGGLIGGWVLTTGVRRSVERTDRRLRGTAARLRAVVPGDPARDPADWVDRSVAAVLDRLRASERAALRAEQLAWVGQMAAGIAHEVRNPLMAIKLLVQAAADRPGGAAFRPRDLEVLEEEIGRLEQTVSGFLDFARPPRPDARPADVAALVAQTVDGVRARADLQGVAVDVTAPPGPVVATVDPLQIRQVVYNLLFNALDAQPAGGRVAVTVVASDGAGGGDLVVEVADGGPGLPADLGDRIFEPFVSSKETGMGLGLSICRRIVESHSGTLTAATRPGGGAVFTARLPLRPAPPTPLDTLAAG